MQTVSASNILIGILVGGSMQTMWGSIVAFQYIARLPQNNIEMPGIAENVFGAMITVV